MNTEDMPKQRLDVWLWQARFFKTRALAAKAVSGGHMRVDGRAVSKPAQAVRPGVVLVFPQGPHVRVIRVQALGTRRGPAEEARALYEDLDPPQARPPADPAIPVPPKRDPGAGRPTKKERRALDTLREVD
jgi:ribosome-associated heat shock protein Hsp15